MKIFTLLLIFISSITFSQTEVFLNPHFIPETKYQKINTTSKLLTATVIGDEETLEKLKIQGKNFPIKNKIITSSNVIYRTGKIISKDKFPVEMEIVNIDNDKFDIPKGIIVYGTIGINNPAVLDSIKCDEFTDDEESLYLIFFQSMFNQIEFPKKVMQVEDTFIMKTPFSIPIYNIKTEIISIYKLISIKNDIALFNISVTVKDISNNKDINFKMSGDGKLEYNIKYHFYSNSEINFKNLITIDNGEYVMQIRQDGIDIKKTKLL